MLQLKVSEPCWCQLFLTQREAIRISRPLCIVMGLPILLTSTLLAGECPVQEVLKQCQRVLSDSKALADNESDRLGEEASLFRRALNPKP